MLGTTQYGTFANRPAAGNIGNRYISSDGRIEFVDDGTVWRPLIAGTPGAQPPTIASASWTTFGTAATFTDATGTIKGVNAGTPGAIAGITVPKAATNTTILHMRFLANGDVAVDNLVAGIAVRDSGGGLVSTWELELEQFGGIGGVAPIFSLEVDHWTTLTAATTVYDKPSGVGHLEGGLWLKFQDDNTNHLFSVSNNGQDFMQLFSEARATFLPSGGNQVGVFIYAGQSGIIQYDSWSSTSP